MTKKAKNILIILGALVLVIAGYIGTTLWIRSRPPEQITITMPDTPRLGNMEPGQIVKIEIPFMTLEIVNGRWEVTAINGVPPVYVLDLDQNLVWNLTFIFTEIWTEGIIDDDPEDLSVYGLDDPFFRAIITDIDGNQMEFIRGNLTPSRVAYYFMLVGDPNVYLISAFTGENLEISLDRVRPFVDFPNEFDFGSILRILIESPERRIEINPMPDFRPTYLTTTFTMYTINSPYQIARGVNIDEVDKLLENINRILFLEYVNDDPVSLAPYGLDNPIRLSILSYYDYLELMVGNSYESNRYYAQLPGQSRVIAVGGLDDILNVSAFDLIEKMPLILHVDNVDRFTITGGPSPFNVEIYGTGDQSVFVVNGRVVDQRNFRRWYQTIIGLVFDAEISGYAQTADIGESSIVIEYELNIFPGARASISLVPYNRDFYAVRQEGSMEFLISRHQVNDIWEFANRLEYLD